MKIALTSRAPPPPAVFFFNKRGKEKKMKIALTSRAPPPPGSGGVAANLLALLVQTYLLY
jgi:hypothetical protein